MATAIFSKYRHGLVLMKFSNQGLELVEQILSTTVQGSRPKTTLLLQNVAGGISVCEARAAADQICDII